MTKEVINSEFNELEELSYNTVIKGNIMEVFSKNPDIAKHRTVIVHLFDEELANTLSDYQRIKYSSPENKERCESIIPERFRL